MTAVAGVVALFAAITWYVWTDSVRTEEARLSNHAQLLGEDVERTIVGARDMLEQLNQLEMERCSDGHLQAMQDAAISKPYIRAVGYWKAAERICGIGFVRGSELTPARADRIYDSGVIAWWPGPQTELGGVQFFLMRYGAHDVAIDPRMLLDPGLSEGRKSGLWVEGLRMASAPWDAELPIPASLPPGLTVDSANNRVISRFSLGTILPIDIVAVEPIASFWDRYLPTMTLVALLGLVLVLAWLYALYRYSRRQLSLGAELREAILHRRLTVHYQPVIELHSGKCIGAEALVRWRREGGSLLGPDVFIPVAERAGLISDITRCVLDTILEDIGRLMREDPVIQINLNLAREDLESPQFLEVLAQELEHYKVPTRAIKLEITERALINSDAARQLIRKLRQRGHQVAIDDFGTGYSSLAYLESFEIDTLKIDKTFVDAIETDAVTSNVIGHVIEMAHSLELDTVAEGIEQPHQVDWLLDQGVTHGQGFFFSKPLTSRRFLRYYQRNRAIS